MNPRLLRPLASGFHSEAAAWRSAVIANGGSVSTSTVRAVSNFCAAIDAAGIRDRFVRLNLFCGDNLNAALVPLYRNRAAYAGRNIIAANEDYLGSTYTYSRLTPTSAGVGPTGGPALTMTETAETGVHLWRTNYSISITTGTTYTFSIYVKDVTNGLILMRDNGLRNALFDVSAETVVASSTETNAQISDAGGGWYRLSIEFLSVNNPGEFAVSGAPDGHSTATLPSYTGDTGHSFTFASPQLEQGTLSAYDLNTTLGNSVDQSLGSPSFGAGDYVETGVSGGLTGNGTSKYLNTGLDSGSLPSLLSGHLAAYMRSNAISATQAIIGADDGTNRFGFFLRPSQVLRGTWAEITNTLSNNEASFAPGYETALYTFTRTAADVSVIYGGDSSANTNTVTVSPGTCAQPWYVFASNGNGTAVNYSTARLAGYSIGNGISGSDMTAYNTATQAFQTALGRNT